VGQPQSASQQPYAQGDYPPGADPTAYIAPARTEYDYSPLDLAPPGQRRRRQFVAAAVGALSVLLLGAIIFFSYLLLRDEEPPSENDDLLASQTEIARKEATLAAEQTIVAQAAAAQTEEAQALSPDSASTTPESGATEPAAGEATEAPAAAGEATEPAAGQATEPAATKAGQENQSAAGSGDNASLGNEQLTELLPAADVMPEGLTETSDSSRTLDQVLEALGSSRIAETNLEAWGWSGNVERQYNPVDPEAVDPATTANITVSIHGFASPEAAGQALPFFSDIVVANGYTEAEDPGLGDSSRMLTMTDENGQTFVALYIQDGSVMYRIGGYSAGGDPSQDVINVGTELVGG
jgi:hypothetical protein